MAFDWNEKNTEILIKMWKDGHSARDIAEKLGGITRNAVIGKANRLNLSKKTTPVKAVSKIPTNTQSVEALDIGKNNKKERLGQCCQWPSGHPGTAEFSFCLKPVFEPSVYCLEHLKLAYKNIKD